jgi:hypothetical protein
MSSASETPTRPCEAAKENSMADVRGKFTVTQITHTWFNQAAAEITLSAAYSNTAEDNTYAMATPTAEIKMVVTNPAAVAKLALGTKFYVDFTAIPEEQAAA